MTRPTITLAAFAEDDIALTDGAWRFDPFKRIQVWVPAEPTPIPTSRLLELVACYSCGAKVAEGCRTKTGEPCKAHAGRLVPRRCPCGASLEARKRYCPPCARESELLSKQRSAERKRIAA